MLNLFKIIEELLFTISESLLADIAFENYTQEQKVLLLLAFLVLSLTVRVLSRRLINKRHN
jgi:hypothetical protein